MIALVAPSGPYSIQSRNVRGQGAVRDIGWDRSIIGPQIFLRMYIQKSNELGWVRAFEPLRLRQSKAETLKCLPLESEGKSFMQRDCKLLTGIAASFKAGPDYLECRGNPSKFLNTEIMFDQFLGYMDGLEEYDIEQQRRAVWTTVNSLHIPSSGAEGANEDRIRDG